MKVYIFLLSLLLLLRWCHSKSEVVHLENHVRVRDIAFITFGNAQINTTFDQSVEVICQVNHNAKDNEISMSELHYKCFSTLERIGYQVNVSSITCGSDEIASDLAHVENPIRDNDCMLIPDIVPLDDDYQKQLERFKRDNAWFCNDFDCTHVNVNIFDIMKHNVDGYRNGDKKSSPVLCDGQICFFNKHSSLEFYKKLLLLLVWGK